MASNSTEYLRFSAYSLKELITRKLASETKFTDLVYEGSNLAILIDIVCYMYQCMLYNINNAAAEAMWSDTQVYENINRLAKLVGYNPKGASPATAPFNVDKRFDCTIPKYAMIDTQKTDENGKTIYYSTVKDYDMTSTTDDNVLFYNGRWKLYGTIFTSSGQVYQTLLLDLLTSDDEQKTYVPSEFIDVYVLDYALPENSSQRFKAWKRVDQGLFTDSNALNGSSIYGEDDCIYNVRLNENKQYEITFGNGFSGKIPPRSASIYVFYLDSNGPYGQIDMGDVLNAKIKHEPGLFGISQDLYNRIFSDALQYDDLFLLLKQESKWQNMSSSTYGKIEESVDDIRRNAPEQFKVGNRLVTFSDWTYYIKNRFKDNILDVVCLNNWGYISSFYRWLYNLGNKNHYNDTYYLNRNRMVKYDMEWADACDTNNVYLWIKMRNDADIYKAAIDEDVQNIKVITQEAVYLKPLNVLFAICAQNEESVRTLLSLNITTFAGNYLEITLDDNSLNTNTYILQQVAQVIVDFFDESNFTLGCVVDTSELSRLIYNLGGVVRIRTVYKNTSTGEENIYPGIAFATWTSDFIDIGDDVEITTISKSLQPFQFPKLFTRELTSKIKVIRKSSGLISQVLY